MKKLLFALILGLLVIAASVTIAMADNGPHGGFTATTDACAGCHRTHTAKGPVYLLLAADVQALCLSCHDGSGAYTNVKDGYYTKLAWNATDHGTAPVVTQGDEGMGLFGGGFENARIRTVQTGSYYPDFALTAPTGAPTTSTHSVDHTVNSVVWGSGPIDVAGNVGGTLTGTYKMECTTCHDPHGKAGRNPTGGFVDPIASYRLLRFNPQGSNGFEGTPAYFTGTFVQTGTTGGVYVADPTTKWYTPNTDPNIDPSLAFWRARRSNTSQSWGYFINWTQGVGDYSGRNYPYRRPANPPSTLWGNLDTSTQLITCANPPSATENPTACAQPAGGVPTFDNTTAFTSMAMWCATCHDRYLAGSGARSLDSGDSTFMYRHTASGSSLACTSCHVSHGTSAASTGFAATGSLAGGSVLLKVDNRGICIDCHGASVNFYSGVVYPVDPNP